MVDEAPERPDPDALLALANARPRGQLKIFFGACAGVGKTYAMLQEAQRLQQAGLAVLAGVVETHGRRETEALLAGLPQLPPRRVSHRGRALPEFDLDAALARRPALILVDELAHSNVEGSRHPKRWQDVEELLNAGIDVLTTVNVQHLESLNDIVGGITGIRVRETVPDLIFDQATEVVLVDLPPDDLRRRLKEGKVYLPGQAERAIEHFFRTGNLIALRELALRRTADRVDGQIRALRHGPEGGSTPRDALLVCIGPAAGQERLVRAAARLAGRLNCPWHAVYAETPRLHRLPEARRRAILQALKLAQALGAETATLADAEPERALLRYARQHGLGRILAGRPREGRRWRRSFGERLARLAPEAELLLIPLSPTPAPTGQPDARPLATRWQRQWQGCGAALALCALITGASQWLLPGFDLSNLVMLYLLGVVVVALFFGRWPSVVAALLNVASFDLFFVQPRGSLAVSEAQYLVTFAVMLTVGLLIGNLTAGVRYQARVARYREQRTRHLYEISTALSQALTPEAVAQAGCRFVAGSFQARVSLLLPDEQGELRPYSEPESTPGAIDPAIARWSFDTRAPAGAGTDTLPGVPYQLLPLATGRQALGLLAVEPASPRQLMVPEQQRLLQTFSVLLANALERLHLAAQAERARVDAEREQLRNSLLAALSHDLRTPLTVLFGQAEILTLDLAAAHSPFAPQASQIRQQVLSTTRLVNNLLDMARIQSGGLQLRKEWQALDELVGSALRSLEPTLEGHPLRLELPPELLLVQCDAGLIERVLVNLLENAHKYAGPTATLGIRAEQEPGRLWVTVWDDGPGIPPGEELRIFDKFARGQRESAIPGVGLGLAICRAIMVLHGGEIQALNRPEGGAAFRFWLPLTPPPALAAEFLEENGPEPGADPDSGR